MVRSAAFLILLGEVAQFADGCCGACGGCSISPELCPIGTTAPAWTLLCAWNATVGAGNNYCMNSNTNTYLSGDRLNMVAGGCPDHVIGINVTSGGVASGCSGCGAGCCGAGCGGCNGTCGSGCCSACGSSCGSCAVSNGTVVAFQVDFPSLNASRVLNNSTTLSRLKCGVKSKFAALSGMTSCDIGIRSVGSACGSCGACGSCSAAAGTTRVKTNAIFRMANASKRSLAFVNSVPTRVTICGFGCCGAGNTSHVSRVAWSGLGCHLSGVCCGACGACSGSCGTCGGCSACGGCGACGACGGYCSGCGSSCCGCCGCRGKYSAKFHRYWADVPASPAVASSSSAVPAGHGTVGISVNGVLIETADVMTYVFDSCMGHVDTSHHYHYHLPPTCLFAALGIPVPVNSSYWLDDQPSRYAAYWPPAGPPSPIVGYALDGFPILGPYDSAGTLMYGTNHPMSTLDQCNGKAMPSGSPFSYAYFWTPTPPYVPSCFRGTPGTLTKSAQTSYCPMSGTVTAYLSNQTAYNRVLSEQGVELFDGSCSETFNDPLFLFRTRPPLDSQRWVNFALAMGVVYAIIAAAFAVLTVQTCASRKKALHWKILANSLLLSAVSARAVFFLADPYYTKKRLPPLLVGSLYGLAYPCVNTSMVVLLFVCLEMVTAMKGDLNKAAKRMRMFLPRTRWAFVVVASSEFVTQFVADLMRSMKYAWKWLVICQAYFIAFGLAVSLGFLLYSYHAGSRKLDNLRSSLDTLTRIALAVGLSGAFVAFSSVAAFIAPKQIDVVYSLREASMILVILTLGFALNAALDNARKTTSGSSARSRRHSSKNPSVEMSKVRKRDTIFHRIGVAMMGNTSTAAQEARTSSQASRFRSTEDEKVRRLHEEGTESTAGGAFAAQEAFIVGGGGAVGQRGSSLAPALGYAGEGGVASAAEASRSLGMTPRGNISALLKNSGVEGDAKERLYRI